MHAILLDLAEPLVFFLHPKLIRKKLGHWRKNLPQLSFASISVSLGGNIEHLRISCVDIQLTVKHAFTCLYISVLYPVSTVV